MGSIPQRMLALGLASVSVLGGACDSAVEPVISVAKLGEYTHIHGIAVDPANASRILLATHDGILGASPDGVVRRISRDGIDFMGFTSDSADPAVLFASGHLKSDGNLGFMVSRDAGKTWKPLSTGSAAPVDFHHMDVSRTVPQAIFAANGALNVSRDDGNTWKLVAPLPDGLVDLAVSRIERDRLYAATEQGLLFSIDGGTTWQPAHARRSLVTLVQGADGGTVYAFMPGVGLLRTEEPSLRWQFVSDDFADRAVLHLAVDPRNPRKIYAVTDRQQVIVSHDKGVSWTELGKAVEEPERGGVSN